MDAVDLKTQSKVLPTAPGVYRLIGADGEVLYVGKARNLRSRVASYCRAAGLSPRAAVMVRQTRYLEFTVTRSESEALLLENNLIKSLHPRFNVQLRDDKSYPYIFVSTDHAFPRLAFHRGAKRERGRYFGPYPSAAAVRESLDLLSKVFQVRQCTDSFFKNRSRPCLQYQIKRCTAPCVGLIDAERYRQDVEHAVLFLEGKTRTILDEMRRRMEEASARLDYETAALYRDRIAALKKIRERQYMVGEQGDADVLAVAMEGEAAAIEVVYVRGGLNLGGKTFFPQTGAESTPEKLLAGFLPQYYLERTIPARLYLSHPIPERSWLKRVFSEQAGKQIVIAVPRSGPPANWVKMAALNAQEALRRELLGRTSLFRAFEALREALALEATPERIECFDISHTFGEAPVAACVVFDASGPVKADYRRFNIVDTPPGDDYGALTQALTRRYRRVKEGEGRVPDLLLIDGGKGQLAVAETVMQELQVEGVKLVAVAKGRERRPGHEQLFLSGEKKPVILPNNAPALHLIQRIRDEAHRFAITGHRLRRARARRASPLERIPGVGNKRRQTLLKNLGGLREVMRAGVDELARVPGISRELAQRIYDAFHETKTP